MFNSVIFSNKLYQFLITQDQIEERLMGKGAKRSLTPVNISNITEFPTTLPTVGVPPVIENALGVVDVIIVVIAVVPAKNRKN